MSNGKTTLGQAQADLRAARAEAQALTAAALKAQELPVPETPATFAAALQDLMEKWDYLRAEWIRVFGSDSGYQAWFTEKCGM